MARVDRMEVASQSPVGEFGDLAGHLDSRRTSTDNDEGQKGIDIVAATHTQLSQLEGPEDATSQLERVVDALHAGRELGEVVIAEVGLPGSRRHDQRVVAKGSFRDPQPDS